MLPIELARRLRTAGLEWTPRAGDRFVLPVSGMEEEVFVISDLTVDVHHFKTGDVIGFNGTTEWALDSIEQDKAVWLPREDQLRDLLGDTFVMLEQLDGGYAVSVSRADGSVERHADIEAERAYARALLAALDEA
ncbi:MAG TPA: pilus assembly protein CpaE [Humibacillus xanthopallidus]|nr:pilus assembly protein CpaE [Humibacillus xanthopallidus]